MANILIQATPIWTNGEIIEADNLESYSIYDNLVSESKFRYDVQKDDQSLSSGIVSIVGNDYLLWQDNSFNTQWALTYICNQLNLISIIPTKTKK
jgi:hypothetical protein